MTKKNIALLFLIGTFILMVGFPGKQTTIAQNRHQNILKNEEQTMGGRDSAGQVQKEAKEAVSIFGKIILLGNEPFTQVGCEVPEGMVYVLIGKSEKELRKLQGHYLKLHGALIQANEIPIRSVLGLKVKYFDTLTKKEISDLKKEHLNNILHLHSVNFKDNEIQFDLVVRSTKAIRIYSSYLKIWNRPANKNLLLNHKITKNERFITISWPVEDDLSSLGQIYFRGFIIFTRNHGGKLSHLKLEGSLRTRQS